MDQRLKPFVHIRLSRQGLGSGFREQIENIASAFPIRIVDARPDPISESIQSQSTSSSVSISLAQISPEEMFRKAFRQRVKAEPTEAQLKIFHNAYAEAQE